jgi:hypothetical protein
MYVCIHLCTHTDVQLGKCMDQIPQLQSALASHGFHGFREDSLLTLLQRWLRVFIVTANHHGALLGTNLCPKRVTPSPTPSDYVQRRIAALGCWHATWLFGGLKPFAFLLQVPP